MVNPLAVSLKGIGFSYGGLSVLEEISFNLEPGQFLTLLGPSGCGKTTLLKIIGGYLHARTGQQFLQNREVTHLPPEKRDIGMVFQHYALFPHLTARANVTFPLEVRGIAKPERERRAETILDLVGLDESQRSRKPSQLSGGQQQRVALARALVFDPRLLLLDEPLANLDRNLRDQFRSELRSLQKRTGVTTIMVTHDQEEAMGISDVLGVMNQGRILQWGSPRDLYDRPNCRFVAQFLGEANIVPGSFFKGPQLTSSSEFLVRPERIVLGEGTASCLWHSMATLQSIVYLGADCLMEWLTPNGAILKVRSRTHGSFQVGQTEQIGIPTEAIWAIPVETDAKP